MPKGFRSYASREDWKSYEESFKESHKVRKTKRRCPQGKIYSLLRIDIVEDSDELGLAAETNKQKTPKNKQDQNPTTNSIQKKGK